MVTLDYIKKAQQKLGLLSARIDGIYSDFRNKMRPNDIKEYIVDLFTAIESLENVDKEIAKIVDELEENIQVESASQVSNIDDLILLVEYRSVKDMSRNIKDRLTQLHDELIDKGSTRLKLTRDNIEMLIEKGIHKKEAK